jgi:ABC-type Fe3+/spermidine/putrescine transport system ATPase subunit
VSQPLIQIRELSIRLGEFAVHEANMEVAEGEYFVLLGPTGAGKTVLLECLAGLYRPDRGEIFVAGQRVNDIPPERRGLGYLPQDYALFPHLNVAQNIGFGMRLRKRPKGEIARKTQELAALLGITPLLRRSVVRLSGGERQRVALARALAIEPKVLLLDEPLSALDEQTREGLCVELRRVHHDLGTTTVHVSHNFEETLMVADRIGIVAQGRVQQVGTPEDVFRRPRSEFVARFVRTENIFRGRARRQPGGLAIETDGFAFEAAEGLEGDICFTVRPEEVALSTAAQNGRPNLVRGRVARIVDRGALIRVDVAADGEERPALTLVALLGRRAFQESGLAIGRDVTASFDPQSVHTFAAAEERERAAEAAVTAS